jgi:predicted metal-dependent peptidase
MERLPPSEFEEIAFELESHHAIFYKLWEMGEMVFDDMVETAAVSFDKAGKYVAFHFNKDFWNRCTPYERKFVICHECLHVWLNHGIRTKNARYPQLVNTALDVVVNHMLVNNFGFDREQITDSENLCWVDTVFGKDENIESDETFEYYYNSLMDSPNTKFVDLKLVDSHEKLSDCDVTDILEKLGDGLSDEEKSDIANTLKKHQKSTSKLPGKDSMGSWFNVKVISDVKKKKCWYELIKQWAHIKKEDDAEAEQWLRRNRRMTLLNSDMGSQLLLPAECDAFTDEDKKVEIWLFLDVSGSCYNLRNHFFSAALTIPEDRIKVRAFSFDTKTYEVDLSTGKLRGGGGTAFNIIEDRIQQELRPSQKHPVVFVFTDGWGNQVRPKEPRRWHWFIDGGSYSMKHAEYLSSKDCNFHDMNDFK